MARISFDRKEIQALYTVLVERGESKFSLAKDQGCYLCGQYREDLDPHNKIVYAKGMNPDVDEYWYEEAEHKLGGDDFGVELPLQWLEVFLEHSYYQSRKVMALNVGTRSVSLAK